MIKSYTGPGPTSRFPIYDKKKFKSVLGNTYNDVDLLSLESLKGIYKTVSLPGEKNSPFSSRTSSITGTGAKLGSLTGSQAKAGVPGKQGLQFDSSQLQNIAPFVSNITNLLRKPPAAPRPNLNPLVTARKPKLVSQREDIDRQIKGVNNTADLALDSNTAAAVKAANLVGGLRAKGQSYEAEANLGIQVDNETNKLNAGITASNLQKIDQYQQNQVEGQIAQQREGSENIANAADKYIQIQAAKDAKDLDRQKFDILSKVYSQSGVTDRLVKQILGKKPGEEVTDEEYKSVLNRSAGSFKMGGSLKKMFANGGSLIEDPKPNPKFTSMAEITATNSFFRKMAKERHLVSGDDTYVAKKVGDPKPFIKYIDENGKTSPKPFKDIQKPLATTVPSGITIDDIKSSGNLYWYEDPHTGDVVDIDPHRVFPNLRPPVQKLNGGKINGRIGSMPHMKGRIKKLY